MIRRILNLFKNTAQSRAAGAGERPCTNPPEPRRPYSQKIADALLADQLRKELRDDDDLRRRVQFDQET